MSGQVLPLDLVSREMKNLNGWFRKYIREGDNGCWIWHGARFRSGYGACGFRGSTRVAHRAVYQLMVQDDLSLDLDLDHLCRVRACVNPDHLEPVSRLVNLIRGAHPTQGALGNEGSVAASAQHAQPCPTCRAGAYGPCRTLATNRVTATHLARRLEPIA